MPKFMFKVTYTPEGLKGLRKDKASGREKAVFAGCEAHGGKCDALYYAIGEDDVIVVADMPGLAQATALAVAVGATGMYSKVQTVALLTVAEMDQVLDESKAYRAPGT
jgi:uncharacterized protein with GYD domain